MTLGRKLFTRLDQAVRDALAGLDATLDRANGRPARLGELQKLVQTQGTHPFARAAAITEVQRFLADPASWTLPTPPADAPDADLAGAFMPHALHAQTLGFAGLHADAAAAMGQARALLAQPAPGPVHDAERRHRETLRALAGSFQRGHAAASGAPSDDAALAPSGEAPTMAYLFEEDAERARNRHDYAAAIEATTRAIAVADAPTIQQIASYACRAALDATSAFDAGAPDARHLLDLVERRLLKPLAEPLPPPDNGQPPRPLDPVWAAEVAFWRGLIALQQARSDPENDDEVAAATERSLRCFRSVKSPQANAATVEAAESWLPDVEKLRAIVLVRRDGQLPPSAAAPRPDWTSVEAALRGATPALDAELGTAAARFLARQRALTLPATAQRLVLEISQALLGDDTDATRLRYGHPGTDRPSIQSLRTLIDRRYGITLPGVLVRTVDDAPGPYLLPLLDGAPLSAPHPLQPGPRFADPARPGAVTDWLSLALEPAEGGEWDQVEYAAWWLGQAVLAALPELVGLPDLRGLGLGDLPPGPILPFIRILLADRTLLTERDTLRVLAADIATGRLSAAAAVAAYRRLPAVRGELWGVAGRWTSLALTPALETELAHRIGAAELAAMLPRDLADRLDRHLDAALRQADPAPPRRLVVRDPALRPFLRAYARRTGRDLPVVTEAEIGA